MSRPPRVLIVDDDREFLSVVFRFLQGKSQFECLSAVDGMDALRQCQEKSPDAVVLDLRLGGRLNGFDVLRFLRADPRTADIEVVLMTGAGRGAADLLKSAGEALGSHVLLRKPFEFPDLANAILNVLEKHVRRSGDPYVIERGPLSIDLKRRRVLAKGVELKLGRRSFDVLRVQAQSKDGLPTSVLRDLVWGPDFRADSIVTETIRRLRARLKRTCGEEVILTIPGGYKLP